MKKARFTLFDDAENHTYFEGWYNPLIRWNGWFVPFFTKEVAIDVLDSIGDILYSYDPVADSFTTVHEITEDRDEYSAVHLPNMPPVYCIGGYGWTWSVDDVSIARSSHGTITFLPPEK